MKIHFKITKELLGKVHCDLARPHAFASERVGFICVRAGTLGRGLVLLAANYRAVADEDYLDNPEYGALMGPGAIRKALEHTLNVPVGMFHVHCHPHEGRPRFSRTDEREMRNFVPDFFNARASLPHGALVLSRDNLDGYVWLSRRRGPLPITKFTVVGQPMTVFYGGGDE